MDSQVLAHQAFPAKSVAITYTFTHEQASHPISCERQSPEISALDRSSSVALPLFIRPISLSSRLFFPPFGSLVFSGQWLSARRCEAHT